MAGVASVEPSSAISISQSVRVWARTEAMAALGVRAASKAGVMTETAGIMVGPRCETRGFRTRNYG